MIMRKLYLKMAQIIIGSFLFDKQWGRSNGNTKTWVATLPISSSQSYLALAGDAGAGAFPIGADANSNTIRFYQQIDTAVGLYYFVISKV